MQEITMNKRINYRALTIKRLQDDLGLSKEYAINYYNRAYTSALASVKGNHKGMNVAREVYGSLFYQSVNTFELEGGGRLVLNEIYQKSKNIPADVLLKKMEGFMEKYGDSKFIQEARESFASGKITRKQFNERIKTFKAYNVRYLISGS